MSEPRYPYVHVDVSAADVELVSAELFELGALGIEERDATTLLHSPGGGELTTLVASFEDDAGALAARDELAARFPARLEHVVGDAWRDAWRDFFKPTRIGDRLVVRPSWEPYEPLRGDVVITLDPGQAFGTGTHESTRLVLGALAGLVAPGMRVLDVGTGSGILSVASLLLGAAHADAIDNDPLAVSAAAQNAEVNGVQAQLDASATPVEALTGSYQLVLANIEARVLVPLAAAIAARVAPGGTLILSGLLVGQGDEVLTAYPAFREFSRPVLGDWCALVLARV